MKKIILSIDGMTCSACSNGLEKYLNKQSGIYKASVNLVMANATIEYDEKILKKENLEEFVKKAGFKSLGEFKEIKLEEKTKLEKVKFIIFSLLAIIILYISMAHMINLPELTILSLEKSIKNYTLTLFILTIPFLIYGYDILKNGYKNLLHKTPNMDTLVGISVMISFTYSLWNMYNIMQGKNHNEIHIYFETTAIVIYFVKLGRYIEGITKNKTKEAIQKLVTITPKKAIKLEKGKEVEVTIDEIKKGDILVCKAGEKIAVDGIIISGKAHFDDSFITGESKPTNKKENDIVLAGSLNYDGYIEYKAQKIGKESTASEIVKLVVEASNTKPEISKLADKVSGYFVPTIIIIAISLLVINIIISKNISYSLTTFINILLVACPCSLGLATPLAVVVSEGLCAQNGILIKRSNILENVQKVDTVVFDKTGTLTYGSLRISEIINYTNIDEKEILKIVGSIEKKTTHPIGKAFSNYIENNNIKEIEVNEFENISGYGVKAIINSDKYLIGNSKLLKKFNIENKVTKDEEKLKNQGDTVIYIAKNNEIISLIGINDVIRENAKKAIEKLRKADIKTVMLTGDNENTANLIAKKLGISEIISNVNPKEKSDIIKKLRSENKYVMMCGDGINDTPALSYSDIGVSIKEGTDIAINSADVILIKNDLNSILKLIKIGKRTTHIIKQNLFWAFFYNILMIPIAANALSKIGITITPMIASLAMFFSSITVILNTLRLKKLNYK